MYLFRKRDRRLMSQAARDLALTLQRDYRTFNPAKTTELSNRVPLYTGYLSTGANAYPNISWTAGSQVSAAFQTLQQLLTQLSSGSYQGAGAGGISNPAIWPVQSINWKWILSLYAYVNPAYEVWAATNVPGLPDWSTHP